MAQNKGPSPEKATLLKFQAGAYDGITRPRISNPYRVVRGTGDRVTLGNCGLCGKNLLIGCCNRRGARCRHCGAQYNQQGEFLDCHGRKDNRFWRLFNERQVSLWPNRQANFQGDRPTTGPPGSTEKSGS